MKKEIKALLPDALRAVEKYLMANAQDMIVHKEYDGYAASLGAAISQSGLLPALSFFTDSHKMDAEGKPYRHILLIAILAVMKREVPLEREASGRELLKIVIEDVYGQYSFSKQDQLVAVASARTGQKKTKVEYWKKEIVLASVALKLAIRTFRHTEDESLNKTKSA